MRSKLRRSLRLDFDVAVRESLLAETDGEAISSSDVVETDGVAAGTTSQASSAGFKFPVLLFR
jgi:hypothetical protein